MMNKTRIGVDNGISGTIGIIRYDGSINFLNVPVKKYNNYTKKKSSITRIDYDAFYEIIKSEIEFANEVENTRIFVAIERPMVNPGRFKATISAIRALEAVEIILEQLNVPYSWIDSKEWQKEMLPHNVNGKDLKGASLEVGNRLFPEFKEHKHSDRDGLLIAEYLRRKDF